MRKVVAEFLGTFILVFGGCGSAVFSAAFPGVGIGLLGVALAFGLTVVVGAYAFGPVSGGHFNPAVTIGLASAGRAAWRDVPAYVASQCIGAVAAAGVLVALLKGQPGGYDAATGGLASNGFGDFSPGKYSLLAGFLAELVLTFIFVLVILGATSKAGNATTAGLAIGLCLTLVHLVGIPITNLSVNPARSTGPALFVGGHALAQLWLFWVAPIFGGVLAGGMSRWLFDEPKPAAA
jgi:aquaporin Z